MAAPSPKTAVQAVYQWCGPPQTTRQSLHSTSDQPSPKALNLSDLITSLLARNLSEVFGEHDHALRTVAISALYASDCVFADHNGTHIGHSALDGAVHALQARLPDFVFHERGIAQVVGDAGRLAWGFGPPEQPPRVTGLDVIVVRENRIAALYVFLDPPSP